jgi:hypothetical protein
MHTCSTVPLAKQASQQVQYVDLGPGAWQKCWKISIKRLASTKKGPTLLGQREYM